jgi:hypothetical protein
MKLLLITGAGASRNLGLDGPLPLMSDWADSLCSALNESEERLARACRLSTGMTGPEFEESLGLLLRWHQVRELEQRFAGLGGYQPGEVSEAALDIRNHISVRMKLVMEAINRTLFEEFGQERVDDERATAAYKLLMGMLDYPDLILATTNYDRSAEAGLSGLGIDTDTGFRARPGRTPLLNPDGMVLNRQRKTPVLHLHGAVGWYEADGKVAEHHADRAYNASFGSPVLLYPDPDKDPTSSAVVAKLWAEFDTALKDVDRVLVLGHSLHDPALLRALEGAALSKPVVVTYLTAQDRDEMQARFPRGAFVPMNFGPEIETHQDVLRRAVETGTAPAYIEAI